MWTAVLAYVFGSLIYFIKYKDDVCVVFCSVPTIACPEYEKTHFRQMQFIEIEEDVWVCSKAQR